MAFNFSNGFRLLARHLPPWTMAVRNINGAQIATGPFPKAFIEIAKLLKINYTFKFQDDGPLGGVQNSKKEWIGVFGKVYRKEADGMLFGVVNNYARMNSFALTSVVYTTRLQILGASTPPESTNVAGLAMVFDLSTWIFLFLSMIVLIWTSGLKIYTDGDVTAITLEKRELLKQFSSYLSAILLEGTPRGPADTRGRFLFGIWWLTVLVVANSFSGHLRASMMKQIPGERIYNLEHLASVSDRIHPITWKDTAYEVYFRHGTSTSQKTIWKSMEKNNGTLIQSEMFSPSVFRRMGKIQAVIVMDEVVTKYQVAQLCSKLKLENLYFAKESFYPHYFSFAFRKDLDHNLLEQFNRRILWLNQAYIVQKWIEDDRRDFERCSNPTHNENVERPLGLDDMGGILYMWMTSFVPAVIAFLSECALGKKQPAEL